MWINLTRMRVAFKRIRVTQFWRYGDFRVRWVTVRTEPMSGSDWTSALHQSKSISGTVQNWADRLYQSEIVPSGGSDWTGTVNKPWGYWTRTSDIHMRVFNSHIRVLPTTCMCVLFQACVQQDYTHVCQTEHTCVYGLRYTCVYFIQAYVYYSYIKLHACVQKNHIETKFMTYGHECQLKIYMYAITLMRIFLHICDIHLCVLFYTHACTCGYACV